MSNAFAIVGSRGYPSTYGGFETLVRQLAPYLAEHGDDVTVYCRDGPPGERVVDGIRCVTTRGLDRKTISTLSYGLTSARHGRRQGYDAALILNTANGYFLPIFRRAEVPTAVNVDGIEWQRSKWNRLGKAVFRHGAALTARHANEIIVDSREIGRIWHTGLGRDGRYIPYGAQVIGDEVPDDGIRQLDIKPGSYALVVARLVPENNVDLFLDAIDSMSPSLPAVVVGSANSDYPLVARLRTRASEQPDFRWLGHIADQALLSQIWSHCAVYFHGHSVGGTNPGLLQALGHGAPTVALDTPFNAEVIDNGEQLVSSDVASVSQALQRVVDDPDRQRAFAAHGRRVIAERFNWDDVLGQYRRLLLSLADSR